MRRKKKDLIRQGICISMDKEVLREIGLTDGEIRVYTALINLGKSSTGSIMDKSGISSSKVYIILEKLVEKGLVSFIIENNVKKFQPTNPNTIIEFIRKKKENLQELENKSKDLISDINSLLGKYEEETAQVYRGLKGIETAFTKMVEETGEGEENLFFSHAEEELEDEVIMFFKRIKEKRLERKIKTKGIVHPRLKKAFQTQVKEKYYKIEFSKITPATPMTIGKKSILMTLWGKEPMCIEIRSKRMVDKYKAHFEEIWKLAKK